MRQPDDAQREKRHRGRVLQVVPADRLCGELADGDAAAARQAALTSTAACSFAGGANTGYGLTLDEVHSFLVERGKND